MQSITFTTDSGTQIEVRNFQSTITFDVVAAVATILDELEVNALNDDLGGQDDLYTADLIGGGGVGIIIPADDEEYDEGELEEELENGYAEGAPVEAQQNEGVLGVGAAEATAGVALPSGPDGTPIPPAGMYYCEGCGGFHPIEQAA